jgi:hypothetical protein
MSKTRRKRPSLSKIQRIQQGVNEPSFPFRLYDDTLWTVLGEPKATAKPKRRGPLPANDFSVVKGPLPRVGRFRLDLVERKLALIAPVARDVWSEA